MLNYVYMDTLMSKLWDGEYIQYTNVFPCLVYFSTYTELYYKFLYFKKTKLSIKLYEQGRRKTTQGLVWATHRGWRTSIFIFCFGVRSPCRIMAITQRSSILKKYKNEAKHTRDFKQTLNWVWDLSGPKQPSVNVLCHFPITTFFPLRIILGILWGCGIIPSGNNFKWRLKREMKNGTYYPV